MELWNMSVALCQKIIDDIKTNGLPERKKLFIKLAEEMFGLSYTDKALLLERLFDIGFDIGSDKDDLGEHPEG
jgi:hypothetical protein